eukprot:TRINITY_DN5857_c0_g2_i4.p1 TRINITY_DN5857_c0_g2~~TRINITY_DN5857_c0_g2_i4.p1  ORF type:complete len:624 (-),score=116.89 TRINITY_DN5857_c0_g2_i4:148-2019(-)
MNENGRSWHERNTTWRSPVSLRGLSAHSTLKQTSLSQAFESKMTTSMCTHETANCLAVVGSGPKGDLKIIRLSADGQELIATRSIRTKAPGYDVCWMKSTILVASNKHSVNLIRMDPALQTKPMDAASEDGIKWDEVYKLPDDSSTSSSKQVMPPGKYPISNRISRVEINPSAENIFGVVENNNFHLWEIENKSEPFHSDQASHTLLTSFDWSPHSVNMMSIAGAAKSVKIFDTRQLSSNSKRGNVWKVSNAHNDVIRCVKWNPLIPHWLASAGDDGLIKVWDTRMNRTSASITLQGHQNAVNSISWCPIRCEILISGGSDHSARLWDLGLHPHNTLASFNKEWTDAIVSSEFIRGRAQSFAFLSGSGQLRAFEITLDFAKSLTQTLDSSSNSALSELEALIFVRDYPTAFEKASKVAEKSIADGKMDETELVLSFCDTEVQDSPENFDAALDLYVRSIPPNLPYMYSPKRVNPDVISKLAKMKDHLHFKKTILQLAQAKDIDGLVSIEKEFFERISIDKTVADMNLITNILKTIIEADYLKGLQAGLRYAEILLKSDLYEEYAMVGHLLLYPTIMDECFNSILTPKLGVHPNADEIVLSSFRNLLGKLKDPSVVNVQVQLLG